MYQTVFLLPAIDPWYSGSVIVPFAASIVPDLSNWTGPTRLGLLSDGGGPKYDRLTAAPTDAGAGSRLHPGPGPIGPGPGPWSMLKVVDPSEASAAATGRLSGTLRITRLCNSAKFAALNVCAAASIAMARQLRKDDFDRRARRATNIRPEHRRSSRYSTYSFIRSDSFSKVEVFTLAFIQDIPNTGIVILANV